MSKIYCFDLDSTILFRKNEIEYFVYPSTLKLLKLLSKDENNILVLATGRAKTDNSTYKSIKKYFSYFIYLNGSLVYHKNKKVYENYFNKQKLQEIVEYCYSHKIAAGYSTLSYLLFVKDLIPNVETHKLDHAVIIDDIKNIINKKIYSMSIITDDKYFDDIKDVVKFSWRLGGCHILPPNTSKGNFLNSLEDESSILISVGDGDNDYDMLKKANVSITYSSSSKLLKRIASIVVEKEDLLYEAFVKNNLI
ncbi:MAG: Cof-type HAD-IIB family hydrolase [Acholeplasmatales bacterium]|jgi:HAD superfamily hydrolase (TIGR01484 family)|nr:Cof-type HAD-IIB family hydrolase [Acholeplasmatales bacterium]